MTGWFRLLAGVAVASATLLEPSQALANGRFPRAQRLLEDSQAPNRLVLAATFGLLVTSDRGASWRHVCEAAFGETDLSVDPLTALTSEGALLAGIYSGVSRAARSPCDFTRTLGLHNREAVPDFALAVSEPGHVLAIKVLLPEEGAPYHELHRSEDDGRSWQRVGELPEALKTPLTIDVAPSNADRVYLSGLGPDESGVLLRSDDGGVSFEALAIPTDAGRFEHPYIAAVAPGDADQLYVRTDLWRFDAATQTATADDALLVSRDGGQTFTVAAREAGKLLGFALSPDGSEYLIGYGDPREAGGERRTEADALGIYRGSSSGGARQKVYAGSVSCLTWSEQGLYVCTDERETGFSLGASADVTFDLDNPPELEPLLVLADVAGPIECGGCSSGAICRAYWSPTCQSWGRTDCVELDAPQCLGEGGAGGSSGEAGQGREAPSRDDGVNRPTGGCACRSPGLFRAADASWVTLLALLALWRNRRRASTSRV